MSDIQTEAHQSAEATDAPFDLRASLQAEYDRQTAGEGAAEPQDEPAPREDGRDDKGRFAPREKPDEQGNERARDREPEGGAEGREAGDAAPAEQGEPSGDGNTASAPPPGWSVASKSAWNDLPAAVKADIAKREQEVDAGFSQYRGMGEIKPYAEHFQSQGGSLKQALDSYMGFERALGQNFVGGIDLLCRQYGVDIRALAQHVLGGQQQPMQQDPTAARLAQLEQHIQAQERARQEGQQREAQQSLEQFARDPKHPYFENVKATMGHLIQTGQAADLNDAYEKACWSNPEIRPLLIKQQAQEQASRTQPQQRQAVADQARQSARSLTGSPAPGGSSADRSKPRSIREIAVEAARQQGVSL